jgi:cobalt-zinc-cadmium efflux system protein
MEATPRDLDVARLVQDVVHEPGVTDIHDLHVWTIAGGMRALSAHLQVEDRPLSTCDELLARVNRLLSERYQIGHATLQVECAGCESKHLWCTMSADEVHVHTHAPCEESHEHDRPARALQAQR